MPKHSRYIRTVVVLTTKISGETSDEQGLAMAKQAANAMRSAAPSHTDVDVTDSEIIKPIPVGPPAYNIDSYDWDESGGFSADVSRLAHA